ncbi:MAG: prolyl oligopeptidase family serine peptidase [Phycisphaerae bacterium]|nr:prolyl oligopeptidase family serine peptidase [Phycisphaerae bacterium]
MVSIQNIPARGGLWLALAAAAILTAGCPITQSQDTPVPHKAFRDQITNTKYYLYVPSTYDKNKTYPLVVTLHGTNPWDDAWMQIREWKSLAEEKQFIVVAPVLRTFSTEGIMPVPIGKRLSALAEDDKAILAICDEVTHRYRVDPKRILLTGFSAGGFPMYYTGLRHPQKFAALIARACNGDPRILDGVGVTKNTRRIPIVIFYGKDDLGRIQKQSITMFQWFRRNGWDKHNSQWKEIRGGHLRRPETCYSYWSGYVQL